MNASGIESDDGEPNQQAKVLQYLFDNQQLADVTLFGAPQLATEGQQDETVQLKPIRAYKNVLAAGSDFFRALFYDNDFADANKTVYTLEKVSHDCLRLAVEALHTRIVLDKQAVADAKAACNLLDAAQYLMMKDLTLVSEKFLLEEHLNVENCMLLWKTACKYPTLLKFNSTIEAYLAKKLSKLSIEESFLRLSSGELCQIMLTKSVKEGASAEVCFDSVFAWLEHDADIRRSYSDEILSTVSLTPGLISRKSLIKACRGHVNVFSESAMKKIMELLACCLEVCVFDIPQRPDKEKHDSTDRESLSSNCFSTSSQAEAEALYCIGGRGAPDSARKSEACFLKYSVRLKEWLWLDSLPWERRNCGAFVIGDQLVIVGGIKNGKEVTDFDEYGIPSLSWQAITISKPINKIPEYQMDGTRFPWLTCSVNDDLGFVYYGKQLMEYSSSTNKPNVEYLATNDRKYTTIVYSEPFDAVYVAGGWKQSTESYAYKRSTLVDKYDVENDTWSAIGSTKLFRSEPGLALSGDDLYLMGGRRVGKTNFRRVEKFNIRTGQTTIEVPALPTDRGVCRAVVLYNNVICVVGDEKSVVDAYDIREGKWTTGSIVPDMPIAIEGFGFTWK